ncbi:hypothetical protein [Streptomyces sp. NPDC091371]|uniref:hypothetical protein n=1 Tax=Streptomyces sp. NPDC091371 TaxID=3155303 RepID=UPI003447F5B4
MFSPEGRLVRTAAARTSSAHCSLERAVIDAELQALLGVAEDCPNTTVVYEPAA